MPKYSFIVPVYNCGSYLMPCVESLLAQTFQDFEILLVDDGSTDSSGALCDALAEEHDRIRVFHKENGGAASARNYGIDRAKGKYLLFVDGDDTIEPDALARIETVNTDCPNDFVIFGMAFDYYHKADTLERVEALSVRHKGLLTSDFLAGHFQALFEDNALSSACNKVFTARILRDNAHQFREDMTLYEDLEFVLRYLSAVERFYCIDALLYHYRIDASNFGHKRAHDLRGIQDNLSRLARTMLTMKPMPVGAADLAAGLYMQLLMRHLLATKYRRNELDAVYRYCDDAQFRLALGMGAQLGSQETLLLDTIDSRDGARLLGWVRKKRIINTLRRTAKRVLTILGLRR